MTDDQRFRAPRPHGHPQPSQAATARVRRTEDPLAELARLIGQEDPFADFVAHRPSDARTAAGVPPRRARPQDSRAFESRPTRRPQAPMHAPDTAEDSDDAAHTAEAPRSNGRGTYAYGTRSAPAPVRSFRDDRAGPAQEFERRTPAADEHDAGVYREQSARQARRTSAPLRDDEAYEDYSEYDPDYDDDAYLPAHGDEFYEEAPRRRLKGWLLVGVAAAAILVVGMSGLFAYRAIFNVDSPGKPPVTIRSESGPTKVVPAETKTAEGGNKQIYDRLGGEPPAGERIVSREERPVTPDRIPQQDRVPQDRIPQSAPAPAGVVTAVPQTSTPAPMTSPPPISTEPRRVRTVTVRSDGTIVSDPGRSAASVNTARTGAATAATTPMALTGQASGGQAPALPPARPSTSGAAPASDNPWANLSASGQHATPGSPAQTQAAAPPQPTPAIAVSTPPPAGSYVVQVAAQKTEADAQATWQALQQRYPTILGGQQAAIRRVDLGERGVFYRAQVGPFSSRAQASEVCQSLKAAGGECVIQRN